jgi:hypothetical protein
MSAPVLCADPVKCEEIHLRARTGVREARTGIGPHLGFSSSRRPHSSLDGNPPDQADVNATTPDAAAV